MVRKLPADEQIPMLMDLLAEMVEAVVEHEDDVVYTEIPFEDKIQVEVRVVPSDMGLVLGRNGSTAAAIRQILWNACRKTDKKIEVMFACDNGRGR